MQSARVVPPDPYKKKSQAKKTPAANSEDKSLLIHSNGIGTDNSHRVFSCCR